MDWIYPKYYTQLLMLLSSTLPCWGPAKKFTDDLAKALNNSNNYY